MLPFIKPIAGTKALKLYPVWGNEAYYQTDQTGFYFFLVRKNQKMLNKVTSHSSVTEFKKAARRIVDKL